MKLLAQTIKVGNEQITGPLKNINTLADAVNVVVQNLLIPLGAIILLFVLMWGGFSLITSQGDPEKLKAARARLTAGIIGFVLLIVSYLLVKVLAYVFGLQQGII